MDDSKLDLMYTNTELVDRVYVDFSSELRDTPPELLYLCAIVQTVIVVPRINFWYMLEHAILSSRGELFFQYSVHESLSNPCHSLPVYTNPVSPVLACRRFTFPIDIENVESLKHCANVLRIMIANGSLTQDDNIEDLHPAYMTDLAVECVQRGMWGLVEILSDGVDLEANMYCEVAGTTGYYYSGYGLVRNVERDEETKKTYYREIIRWVEDKDGEDEAD
ncbi:hypothetical protein DFS33DRAFT_1384136 [Desarmillaria ectypa]|nr:hypothetical protein DFS33DRAFT_1384136 [Desarmillaria ectypa]